MTRSTVFVSAAVAALSWEHDLGRYVATLSTLLAVGIIGGCDSRPVDAMPAADTSTVAISVRPERILLAPRETAQLRSQADDPRGQPVGGANFNYHSGDSRIATVDSFGHVTAVGPAGRTEIVVRSGSLLATVPVRVDPGPPAELQPVSGDAQRVTAGTPAREPWVVRLRDADGNPIAGVALQLRVDAQQDSAQAITDQDGEAHWMPELPTAAGEVRMVVEPAEQGTEQALTLRLSAQIVPAPIATLDVDAAATTAADARPAGWRGSVVALDRFGNRVPQAPIEWQVAAACGRVRDSTATTTDSGTASITIDNARKPPRGCRVVARSADGSETAVPLR